ncbi:MAG: hypothetical protein ABSF26_11850 [Thermoguttaceae bacterium]
MTPPSRLRLFYLLHLSKPAADRIIYRAIQRSRAASIVELGIGTARRAVNMIQLAGGHHPARAIRYTGIDLFEDRRETDPPGVSLRRAHCLLTATGARIRLVPATPAEGLSRTANMLGKADLVILSALGESQPLARAWFYIPRLLHDRSLVFLEELTGGGRTAVRLVSQAELDRLAGAARRLAA